MQYHDTSAGMLFRAVRSFQGNGGGSHVLEFKENDIIEVMDTHTGTQGWWKGRVVRTNRIGLFPADYVRRSRMSFEPNWNPSATFHRSILPGSSGGGIPGSVAATSNVIPEHDPLLSGSGDPLDNNDGHFPFTPASTTLVNQGPNRRHSSIPDASAASVQRSGSNVSAGSASRQRGTSMVNGAAGSGGPAPPENYINFELQNYPWFAGALSRELAERLLHNFHSGTYLVRFSPKQQQHAISLSYSDEVKHVKIERSSQGYYLDTNNYFSSIVELIHFYESNSLQESFNALDTTLKMPIKMAYVGCAVAMHDFESTAPNMISLHRGEFILITSKLGGERGWWKGKIDGKIGYFPLAYVEETDHVAPTGFSELLSRISSMSISNDNNQNASQQQQQSQQHARPQQPTLPLQQQQQQSQHDHRVSTLSNVLDTSNTLSSSQPIINSSAVGQNVIPNQAPASSNITPA